MKIASSICELIGNTPMVRLSSLMQKERIKTELVLKLESFNPLGSVKDRVALAIIAKAEKESLLKPGSVIVEPTSGNMGIGLAFVCAQKNYRLILTMPSNMSIERRRLLHALGAEMVLTKPELGMQGALLKADELAAKYQNSFRPSQFKNPENPKIHYQTTAQEIWRDCSGKIDGFIAGIGTGGTITGVGEYLKEKDPSIQIYGVEPASSAVLSGEKAGPHKLQGIGAGFIPDVLKTELLDTICTVSDQDAYQTVRNLAHTEGIPAGISTGAALTAAIKIAKKLDDRKKRLVILSPDSAERYLTVPRLFEK